MLKYIVKKRIEEFIMLQNVIRALMILVAFVFVLELSAGNGICSDRESPDDDAVITASAGIGYYNWQMKYATDFGLDTPFDHSIQPFILKRFEVKASLFFLEAGASYLTNKVNEAMDFEEDPEMREEEDPLARQLGVFAGIHLGSYAIKTSAVFRKFRGNIKSNGVRRTLSDDRDPLYYYPETGDELVLNIGDEVNWYTIFRLYEIKLVKGGSLSRYSWDFGFQYIQYESPTQVDITIGHEDIPTGLPEVPSALMYSKYRVYNLIYGFHNRFFFLDNLYLEFYFPVIVGINRLENSYMNLDPHFGYPMTNLTASTVGQVALRFVTGHVKIEIGGDFNLFISIWNNKTTLERDLSYLDQKDGTPRTLEEGTDITVRSWRYEYFWGVYAQASAYF